MSEWKPGDVALLSVGGEEVRALVVNELGLAWRIAGHSYFKSIAVDNDVLVQTARPLIVIDPEDRRSIENLRDLYDVEIIRQNGDPDPRSVTPPQRGNALQAALREFARPTPLIEEPQGLGAVVEDAKGQRFVLRCDCGANRDWWPNLSSSSRGLKWDVDFMAVRILSPGVES